MKDILATKYKELIHHISKQLVDFDGEQFYKFIKEINDLEKAALIGAELLYEVRTGEDFECLCWGAANKIRAKLGIEKDDDEE